MFFCEIKFDLDISRSNFISQKDAFMFVNSITVVIIQNWVGGSYAFIYINHSVQKEECEEHEAM